MYNQTAVLPISKERAAYLQKQKRKKYMIRTIQISVVIILLAMWEILANIGVIDSFIMSQPSRMVKTLLNLGENGLLTYLGVTCMETLIGFLLGTVLGVGLAVLLWWSKTLSRICEPFLVVLNALPKIALGPVFIVWVGAGMQAIIVMALAISLIVTVLEMLNGFLSTDEEMVTMVRTFGADRRQVFTKVVMPSNLHTLFNSMKVNIGLSRVGVIAGEFLVSKAGLGYLIVYGGQVFKLDLVMTSVVILAVVAALLYQSVVITERVITRKMSHRN